MYMDWAQSIGTRPAGDMAASIEAVGPARKQEKNEGFLTTARHGYKKGGHGVFRGGGMGGCPPTPQPSENVEGELLQ